MLAAVHALPRLTQTHPSMLGALRSLPFVPTVSGGFRAPEQLYDCRYDARNDAQKCLCITVFEALSTSRYQWVGSGFGLLAKFGLHSHAYLSGPLIHTHKGN